MVDVAAVVVSPSTALLAVLPVDKVAGLFKATLLAVGEITAAEVAFVNVMMPLLVLVVPLTT